MIAEQRDASDVEHDSSNFPWWSLKRYIGDNIGDYAATYGAAFSGKFRGFIVAALVVRYAGFSEYGAYALGGAVSQVIGTLAMFGSGTALVLEWPGVPSPERRSLVVRLLAGTGLVALIFVLGFTWLTVVLGVFVETREESVIAALSAATALAAVVASIGANVYRSERHVKQYAMAAPLRLTSEVAGLAIGLLLLQSIIMATWISLMAQLIVCAFYWATSLRMVASGQRAGREIQLRVARSSAAIAGTQIAQDVVNRGDRLIIAGVLGSAALGVYSAAYAVASVVYSLLPPLTSALLPHLRDEWKTSRPRGMAQLQLATTLFGVAVTGIGIGLVVFRGPLLALLVGRNHASPVSELVPILVAGTLIYVSGRILNIRYLLDGRAGTFAWLAIGGGAVDLILAYFLSLRYGISGAALATVAGYGVLTVAAIILLRRRERVPAFVRSAPLLLSSGALLVMA